VMTGVTLQACGTSLRTTGLPVVVELAAADEPFGVSARVGRT
jgi:hypothetical protein